MVLLGTSAAVTWLLGTEGGNRRLLQWTMGDRVHIASFHGSLLGRMELSGVEYREEQQVLEVQTLRLSWRPWALSRRDSYSAVAGEWYPFFR